MDFKYVNGVESPIWRGILPHICGKSQFKAQKNSAKWDPIDSTKSRRFRSWKKLVISIVEGNFRRTKSLKQIAELLKILKILKRSQVSLGLQNFPKSTNPQKKSWNLHLAYPTATLYNPQPLDTHGAAGCSVPRWSVGAALGDAPSSDGWGVWKLRVKRSSSQICLKKGWKNVENMCTKQHSFDQRNIET